MLRGTRGQQPLVPVEQNLPEHLGQTNPARSLEDLLAQGQGHQPQEEVDPRKLCILGLPWDATEEILHEYFSQYGPIEEATIIRKAKSGESRGFGFVTYRNVADAQHVRTREHNVGGRHCDAKQALPRGSANPNRTARLFIGKIPPSVTDTELREYFENFGRVQDAYIPKDAATGKQGHRGFGFVTFASPDDVDKVMSCAHSIHDQEVAVQCAIPKEKVAEVTQSKTARWSQIPGNESYPSSTDSSLSNTAPGQGYFALPSIGYPQFPAAQPGMSLSTWAASSEPATSRLSGEFPRASGEQNRTTVREDSQQASSTSGRLPSGILALPSSGSLDLSHFDRLNLGPGSGSNSASRRSSVDLNGQRLGSNDLANEQTFQALQGLKFGTSREGIGIGLALLQARSQAATQAQAPVGGLQVDVNRQNQVPFQGQIQHQPQLIYPSHLAATRQHQLNGVGLRHMPQRPMYNLPPSNGHTMNVGPGEANAGPRIFVGKLNKDTNEQDVKEYFTKFGYVLDVYMPRDKVKRTDHRGFGFVTFETEAAIQRIAQHGPHQIKGSMIAIDSAAPRREELPPGTDEHEDRTPTAAAAAAAAAQALNLHGYGGRLNVISPSATAAVGFGNGGIGSPGSSGYGGVNGIASPRSVSHQGGSPTMPSHLPVAAPFGGVDKGSRRVSLEQPRLSFEQMRPSLDGSYGTARNVPLERVRNFNA